MRVVFRRQYPGFDLNRDGEVVDIPVAEAQYVSIEVELDEGSWGSATLAVWYTLSGRFYQAVSGGSISTGTRIVLSIDVRALDSLRVALAAKAGAAGRATVWVVGKAE